MLHAGSIPETDLATWDFVVEGEVENPIRLSWDEFNALPRTSHTQDIHCVTRWSRFDVTFEGVHWSALEELVEPLPSARFVVAHAEQGYTANVPIAFSARPALAPRDARRRRAAHAGARRATPPRHPRQVLLEEREVAARNRAHRRRPARLLGALRVPQRRRPVRGGAIRLLPIEEPRFPPKGGRDIGAFRRQPGSTQSSPVLPPLSGRPSGHSCSGPPVGGWCSPVTKRRAGTAGPSSPRRQTHVRQAATVGRSASPIGVSANAAVASTA